MTPAHPTRLGLTAALLVLPLAACGSDQQAQPAPASSAASAVASASQRVGGDEQRDVNASQTPASPDASDQASTAPSGIATPGEPASPSEAASGQASGPASGAAPVSLPTPAGPAKRFATAALPAAFGDYTGNLTRKGDTSLGMYTGKTPDQMLMVSMVKGATDKVAAGLESPTVVDHAVCGKQVGVETCLLLLDGGYVHVQGTDKDTQASLARASNQLWSRLAG